MQADAPFVADNSHAADWATAVAGGVGRANLGPDDPPPVTTYHLQNEYTTFEFYAEDVEAFCTMVQRCCDLEGSVSGSGSSGSGTITVDPGPYTGPCTCPPGYTLTPVIIDTPNGPLTVMRCKNDFFGNIRLCNEDPGNPNPGGGSGGSGSGVPELRLEFTTFLVPESVRIISKRTVNIGLNEFCEPCP